MKVVAVGTEIALRPPHKTRRALLTHRAPTLDDNEETASPVKTASRMRACACDTATRLCVRTVHCSSAFSLALPLRSTNSATAETALFVRFIATMSRSDFSLALIVGYGLRPSRRRPGHDGGDCDGDLPVPGRKASAHARDIGQSTF